MKKYKYIVSVVVIVFIVLCAGAIFIAYKLPDNISLSEFANGVIGIELKNELFVEVNDNKYFYKNGNLGEVQDALAERSIRFVEQNGTTYVCEMDGKRFLAEWQSVTYWHSILVLYIITT